jgi:alpha 1,3-mannosyltransferase
MQRTLAELHTSSDRLFAANSTVQDFGWMGRKVGALADLAEHYTSNPSLDTTPFTTAVVQQFPWWNAEKLSQFPWKPQSWHNAFVKEVPWLNTGIGIVVCAGDKNAWDAAFIIASLRNVLHSELPIQIAYNGEKDLSPLSRRFLEASGKDVSFIDLTKVFDNSLVGLSSWATKPFALIASNYSQTILMDADIIYFSSPDKAISRYPGLSETGALFFHDKSVSMPFSDGRTKWVTEQIEKAGRTPSVHLYRSSLFYRGYVTEEQDSATIFVDKSRPRLYMALLFAAWMNTKAVREPVTYRKVYGDKETFWLAAELSGAPYTFESWSAGQLGVLDEDDTSSPNITRSIHMAHADADGKEPLWANCGIWWNKRHREKGFGNWTHWYLGSRLDEVIETYDPASTSEGHLPYGGANIELSAQERKEKIMATQAHWETDGKDSYQHDAHGWRILSPRIRSVIEASLFEATKLDDRYQHEIRLHDSAGSKGWEGYNAS